MRVHHLALRTNDLLRLESFYVGLLGLQVTRRTERSVWLDAGGTIVMLERAEATEPPVPAGTLELTCFAIAASEREPSRARLLGAGVPVEAETEFTMYFRDPDGRRVGLSHF